MKDSVAVHDKMEILNCFNKHFISSGSLFDFACSVSVKPCTDWSVFLPFSVQEVHKALKT